MAQAVAIRRDTLQEVVPFVFIFEYPIPNVPFETRPYFVCSLRFKEKYPVQRSPLTSFPLVVILQQVTVLRRDYNEGLNKRDGALCSGIIDILS